MAIFNSYVKLPEGRVCSYFVLWNLLPFHIKTACCRAVAQESFPVPVAGPCSPAATATLPLAAAVPTQLWPPVEWNLCHSPYGSCPKMGDTGIPEMAIKSWLMLMLGNPLKMTICSWENLYKYVIFYCHAFFLQRAPLKSNGWSWFCKSCSVKKKCYLRFTPLLEKPVWQNQQDNGYFNLFYTNGFLFRGGSFLTKWCLSPTQLIAAITKICASGCKRAKPFQVWSSLFFAWVKRRGRCGWMAWVEGSCLSCFSWLGSPQRGRYPMLRGE